METFAQLYESALMGGGGREGVVLRDNYNTCCSLQHCKKHPQ